MDKEQQGRIDRQQKRIEVGRLRNKLRRMERTQEYVEAHVGVLEMRLVSVRDDAKALRQDQQELIDKIKSLEEEIDAMAAPQPEGSGHG